MKRKTMVKKTKSYTSTRCEECGTYDLSCKVCKEIFEDNQTIFCDDERYNNQSSGNHYCFKCYMKIEGKNLVKEHNEKENS